MDYVKENQHYDDLYDLFTIEDCLRFEALGQKREDFKNPEQSNLKPTKSMYQALNEIAIYYRKGEWFKDKQATIQKWKDRDIHLQNLYDNTPEPHMSCQHCDGSMKIFDKTVHDFTNEKTQVLFFLECTKCGNRAGVFADGSKWTPTKHLCPKCSNELTKDSQRKDEVITTTYRCTECGYQDIETLDLAVDDKEYQKKQRKDRELLEKYRSKYCMSLKEGQEYISSQIRFEQFQKADTERKNKELDPAYWKAKKLEKVSVIEIETRINKSLENTQYIRLSLDKPEIDRFVIVPFTIQEANLKRTKYDSVHQLQIILKKTLASTNWRLMSEGVVYRAGYLSGKLKAYESEAELMKLIKAKHSPD